MKSLPAIILSGLALASPIASFATSYTLSVVFSASAADVNGTNHTYDFAGEFSAAFSNAGVSGSGYHELVISPLSVSFANPTIGSTTFDAANTGISLWFWNGSPEFIFFGDAAGPAGIGIGSDDFFLALDFSGKYQSLLFYTTTASPADFAVDFSPSFRYSLTEVAPASVPESNAVLHYLVGVCALIVYAAKLRRSGRTSEPEGVRSLDA